MYDFDQVHDRRNTGSLKWDVAENELPLWVADMDFACPPAVAQAIAERAEQGIFGYSVVPDAWYEAYMGWWEARHGVRYERDWLAFCAGVVPAISSAVRCLTNPGDKVVLQTPVYNAFFNCIEDNGRRVLENPLAYRDGAYEMDLADLEAKLADPRAALLILCNPHNPVGKIWDVETLARVGELCEKHGVVVVSDEIHCDITAPGVKYVPFISAGEACARNSVTCVAPTKTFNIAGLQTSAIVVPNARLRERVMRALSNDKVAEPNFFACAAAQAAFEHGAEWLDELREYVFANREFAGAFLRERVPEVRLVEAQATYLLWVDCSAVVANAREFVSFMRERTGLMVCPGEAYGKPGAGFVRINVACPRCTLEDAMNRFACAVAQWKEQEKAGA